MINELVEDYSAYVKVDLPKELAPVEETVEDMLTRLEEFESLMTMVSNNGSQCLSGPIPEIIARREELEALFKKIDNLEVLVNRVKKDVAIMEAQVETAEAELGLNENAFKNMFKPFFKKSDASSSRSPRTYEPPVLFKASDYFPQREQDISLKEKSNDEDNKTCFQWS